MKSLLRILTLLIILQLLTWKLSAQPANDDCTGAFNVIISESEEHVLLTYGDTRGATASSVPNALCSPSWYTDDIFFKFTTPPVIDSTGIIIRAYFDPTNIASDVRAIGMALFASCDSSEIASHCFSSAAPEDDHFEVSGLCLLTNHTYFLRVWSTGSNSTTEGTLRIGIFPGKPIEKYLWWETFGGGLELNGWTTYGTCLHSDSADNAANFMYLPDGIIDMGCYALAGTGIKGITYCDGAVGVDSDYNDCCDFGGCYCSTPGHHFLISPALFSGDWNVHGLSLNWTQAIRQYQSTFFISYRTRDKGSDWADWSDIEVNTEFVINSNYFLNNVQQYFLPGAAGHDSIQIRFIYNDNYYFWAIDDVKIVETACSNTRIQSNFFAIAPFAAIPADQVYPFAGVADIYNAGACMQTNVSLNLSIKNIFTDEVVYDETREYGNIDPDYLAQNKLFPALINLPHKNAGYQGTYHLSQDSIDYNPSDNEVSFSFGVGGITFALESGATRAVAMSNTLYVAGAPLSYTYGNIFMPAKDAGIMFVSWGVSNATEMTGKTVSIYLLEWTDTNRNKIAEHEERVYVGFNEYTFSGSEGDNVIIDSDLVNFNDPGSSVIMQGGKIYMVVVEYSANFSTDPQFFMLASDEYNYTAQELAMDSAVAQGIALDPLFFTVLGFSPDGNVANIDYEVRELNVNDTRIFFGNNIVPLIRIIVSHIDTLNTKDELPSDNIISIYPNPVSEEINVKMEFKKSYSGVRLRLVNTIGQTVFTKTLSTSLTEHIERINVSRLTSGNYMLQVETPDGQRSLPVIVVR